MCGLAGFVTWNATTSSESRLNILSRMSRALAHRGPDDESFYLDEQISLLFRRLSIIDVRGGQQPLWNEDHTICVLVNGEIYNYADLRREIAARHRFSSNSDSEVVVHLYEDLGEKVFSRLNGMFAIAIWDQRQQKILLSRDHLGIKPLYFYTKDDFLLFGSELKALLCHPSCPREIALGDFSPLQAQWRDSVPSYVKDIAHVPGGCYFEFARSGVCRQVRYWDPKDYIVSSEQARKHYEDAYADLITDSVKKQLMSDVPIGVFLSGGLDSSLISTIAGREHPHINCFTVVERTTDSVGDVAQAQQIAKRHGLSFHPAYYDLPKIAESFDLGVFERYIAMMDSPRFDLEWLFKHELHRFARQTVPGIKVILLGQGADEFAGGYSYRVDAPWASWDQYIEKDVLFALNRQAAEQANIPEYLSNLFGIYAKAHAEPSPYQKRMLLYVNQLQHFNLWHEDRSSSFASIEARVPFLDHRLVELTMGIDKALHPALFWDKGIVRSAMSRIDPHYPKNKRKAGFFQVQDTTSTDDFLRRVLLKILPELKDKYLHASQLISLPAFDRIHANLRLGNGSVQQASMAAAEMAALLVFERFLQDPLAFAESDSGLPLLPELDAPELEKVKKNYAATPLLTVTRQWNLGMKIALPAGCRVITPLTEGDDKTELMLTKQGKILTQVGYAQKSEWITLMLEKMGRTDEPLYTVKEWAKILEIMPQKLVNNIDRLVDMGVLEIID